MGRSDTIILLYLIIFSQIGAPITTLKNIFILLSCALLFDACDSTRYVSVTAPESTPDPPAFVPVDQQPVLILEVRPDFPESARILGISGTVWVKMLVDTTGYVRKAAILKSDNAIFNQPSLTAVLQWKFTPALLHNEPIACWVAVALRFAPQPSAP